MAERIEIVKSDKPRGGGEKSSDPGRERQTNKSGGNKNQDSRKMESSQRLHGSGRKGGKND